MSAPDFRTTTPEAAARVESHHHAREPRQVDVYAEDLIPAGPHVDWHAPGCWACDWRRAGGAR